MTASNYKLTILDDKLQINKPSDPTTSVCGMDAYGYWGPITLNSLRLPRTNPIVVTHITGDGTLGDNSDSYIATEKAVKTYIDNMSHSSITDPFAMNNVTISSTTSSTMEGFRVDNKTVKDNCQIDIEDFTINKNNNTGNVTLTPSGSLNLAADTNVTGEVSVTSVTAPQLTLAYVGTHSLTTAVTSVGNATLTASGAKIDVASGNQLNVLDATDSSSITTGSSTFKGGVGITKDLWVGGTIHGTVSGGVNVPVPLLLRESISQGPQLTLQDPDGNFSGYPSLVKFGMMYTGDFYIDVFGQNPLFTIVPKTIFSDTTESSTTAGALITYGGVLCKKNLNVLGNVVIAQDISLAPSSKITSSGWVAQRSIFERVTYLMPLVTVDPEGYNLPVTGTSGVRCSAYTMKGFQPSGLLNVYITYFKSAAVAGFIHFNTSMLIADADTSFILQPGQDYVSAVPVVYNRPARVLVASFTALGAFTDSPVVASIAFSRIKDASDTYINSVVITDIELEYNTSRPYDY